MAEKKKRRGGPRKGMTQEQREQELQQMLSMRRSGASYTAIARHFGLDRTVVTDKIRAELRNIPKDEATELRTLEALKLDQAEVHLQAGVKAGDPRAITTLVRISESRRRLLGLDMPEQHEVRISREEETLIDQLAAALAERDRREDREGL